MKRTSLITAVAIVITLITIPLPREARAGEPNDFGFLTTSGFLDPTFGGGFVTALTPTSNPRDLAVQDDGKVIVVGRLSNSQSYWAIVRFNTDGTLDTGFGNAGQMILFGSSNDHATDVAIAPDGKILVTGWKTFPNQPARFTLVRLTSSGALDTAFGTNGVADIQIGKGSISNALAVQPDGKVVVAGYAYNKRSYAFTLARFNTDGSLDTQSFGDIAKATKKVTIYKGYKIHDIDRKQNDQVYEGAIALQADGKILLGGHLGAGVSTEPWLVARYNANGSVDTGFASGGVLQGGDFGYTYLNLRGIATYNDGNEDLVYVYGRGWGNTSWIELVLLRYDSNGNVDMTFGSGGLATTGLNAEHQGRGIAIQPDGMPVVTTNHYAGSTVSLATFRFDVHGALDRTYGNGGMSQLVPDASGWAVAIGPWGGIYAAGGAIGDVMGIAKFCP